MAGALGGLCSQVLDLNCSDFTLICISILSLSLIESGPAGAKQDLAGVSGLIIESNVVLEVRVTLLELLMPRCVCVCVCGVESIQMLSFPVCRHRDPH